MFEIIKPIKKITGEIKVCGDKSISHRALIFSSIAEGKTNISGFLMSEDCMSTIKCLQKLGVIIEVYGENLTVYGKGKHGLLEPKSFLDVGNSGTTIRLLMGLLSWQNFDTTITGDYSIQKRPMDRVILPLKQMGANISGVGRLQNDSCHKSQLLSGYATSESEDNEDKFAPVKIIGSKLHGIKYKMPLASAQVKSAILLANLGAGGGTEIIEPIKTRDHTEILLNYMGANIKSINGIIRMEPISKLEAKDIVIPRDISSAAFFIVAALIIPNSEIIIKDVLTNPTRMGIIKALKQMGGNIEIINQRKQCGELFGDIVVKSSSLRAIKISGEIIPSMIDEIPIFAVAAAFANGKTIIENAGELKFKESNRIKSICEELAKMGVKIIETADGMIIQGGYELKGANVESHNDHRIAMSLAIAGLAANGDTIINNSQSVNISFPDFFKIINELPHCKNGA